MAFVCSPSTATLRVSGFTAGGIDTKPRRATAAAGRVRMDATNSPDPDDPKPFGSAGKTPWKDNLFVGGFPGGEGFFKKWVEEGLSGDVPDIPKAFQPTSEFKPKEIIKDGLLAALDKLEFFQGLEDLLPGGDDDDEEDEDDEEDSQPSASSRPKSKKPKKSKAASEDDDVPPGSLDREVPDKSLYDKYFPEKYLNKAPHIFIEYNKSNRDRVGVAMSSVTAAPADVHFPKEMKNKAPMIRIYYTGNIASAYVQMTFEEVKPPTTLPKPTMKGDVITSLKTGSGGGLKFDISIAGGGS